MMLYGKAYRAPEPVNDVRAPVGIPSHWDTIAAFGAHPENGLLSWVPAMDGMGRFQAELQDRLDWTLSQEDTP